MSESPPDSVSPLGRGRYVIAAGTRRHIAYAVRSGSDTWVFIDGRVQVVAGVPGAGTRRHPRADDETALAAPMPATVISVQTESGQHVSRGDVLVMLEAMKMELAIRAPRDGVVRHVACRPGELVQPGVPLVEID